MLKIGYLGSVNQRNVGDDLLEMSIVSLIKGHMPGRRRIIAARRHGDVSGYDGLRRAMREAFASRDLLGSYGRHNPQRARDWNPERIAAQTGAVYGAFLTRAGRAVKN